MALCRMVRGDVLDVATHVEHSLFILQDLQAERLGLLGVAGGGETW